MTSHIAHMNWGILRADWEDPLVAEFVEALDRVNAVAARSPGFVWRMPDDEMAAEQAVMDSIGPPDRVASTLSVWERVEDFDHFVHKTVHGVFLRRGSEWLTRVEGPAYVIWPIAVGHRPTVAEAIAARLRLWREGASDGAFDFAYFAGRAA